jgi:hypothetical protein
VEANHPGGARCGSIISRFNCDRGSNGGRAELEAGEFESARESEPALTRFTLAELVEFGRWPTTKSAEHDAVWLAIVRCCRHRDARIWTPVLLQMLAPAIINEAYGLALAGEHLREELLLDL